MSQTSKENMRVSDMAVVSLVFGCLSIILGPFGCLPAIVCGHLARRNIRRNPNLYGRGIALAGLVIGYAFLILLILVAGTWVNYTGQPDLVPETVTTPDGSQTYHAN